MQRLLINRDAAGVARSLPHQLGIDDGLAFRFVDNYRDMFLQGDCQRTTMFLARALGMSDEVVCRLHSFELIIIMLQVSA